MSDLVERLRDPRWTHPPHSLLLEAANEIKRLRNNNDNLHVNKMSNFDLELKVLIENWWKRGENLESMVEAMRGHIEHLEVVLKTQPEMRRERSEPT